MQKTKNTTSTIKPWVIWGLAATVFFTIYIVRVAPSAIVPKLIERYQSSLTGIGSLGFYFFIAYVGMQIPAGLIVDRFGSRVTLTCATGLCTISTYLFAVSETLWVAQSARFLLGFGAAFVFVNALKLVSCWFPTKILSILIGATQALGMIGAAAGVSLISRFVKAYGIEYSLLIFTGILFALTVFIGLYLQNKPQERTKKEVQQTSSKTELIKKLPLLNVLKIVLTHPATWIASITTGFLYAPTGVLGELWGSFYLSKVHGLPTTLAADTIGFLFIAWSIGGPCAGALSNIIGRRYILIISSVSCLIIVPCILYLPNLSVFSLSALLFLFGLMNSGTIAGYTIVAELHPKAISGTALGFVNGMSVIVSMACQPLVGIILDYLSTKKGFLIINATYTSEPLKLAISVIVISLILACIFAFFTTETLKKQTI